MCIREISQFRSNVRMFMISTGRNRPGFTGRANKILVWSALLIGSNPTVMSSWEPRKDFVSLLLPIVATSLSLKP